MVFVKGGALQTVREIPLGERKGVAPEGKRSAVENFSLGSRARKGVRIG